MTQLDDDGELEWITLNDNGQERRVDHEPDTTFYPLSGLKLMEPGRAFRTTAR